MRLIKVALDCDIPGALAPMLNAAFAPRGFQFFHVSKIVPPGTPDETWASAFKRFGGEITVSADKNIIKKPHKALGFLENGFKAFFMPPHWSNAPGRIKLAHLVYWWPGIAEKARACTSGACWQVPLDFKNGVLKLASEDFKELRIPERVLADARKDAKKSGAG